jgi:hypothetical protein
VVQDRRNAAAKARVATLLADGAWVKTYVYPLMVEEKGKTLFKRILTQAAENANGQ